MRVIVLALLFTPAEPAQAALSEAPRLAAVYDMILNARFDQAGAELKRTCPPAPAEACGALSVASLWWQIFINPESRRLDRQLNDLAAGAIAASEGWTRREPERAEAWFYLAGSYAPLLQWRVLRGERLAAARDGKKIKDALERARALDSTLADAYFGIGIYHYYADVVPPAMKILRWLRLLPAGDRAAGLREMLQAQEHGELVRGEADFQLSLVYLWYEQKTSRALELLANLDARYPFNPLFRARMAEIYDGYLHDRQASASAWGDLLTRSVAGTVYDARTTEVRARLGLAAQLAALKRASEAIEQLKIVIALNPTAPPDARTRAERALAAIRRNFFDFFRHIVLDSVRFSSIIYIWYEDGERKPSLVRPSSSAEDDLGAPKRRAAVNPDACQAAAPGNA